MIFFKILFLPHFFSNGYTNGERGVRYVTDGSLDDLWNEANLQKNILQNRRQQAVKVAHSEDDLFYLKSKEWFA